MRKERYSRHYVLPGFGELGQQKLQAARVLVVGAGGLGCPVLQYLAAAGVGTLGIIDHDHVGLSNLHRQVLYDTNDIGRAKAEVAANKLKQQNPDIEIHYWVEQLHSNNVADLIRSYDLIMDCTDNFAARYLLCDACRLLDKPLVFAAIYQYEGQIATFNVADKEGIKTNYRHLFPTPPTSLEAPDCNVAGVLGVLAGMIGILQATEAIKLLTGIGSALINKLMTVNMLDNSSYIFEIPLTAYAETICPQTLAELSTFNYEQYCASESRFIQAIDAKEFVEMWSTGDVVLVDVRDPNELPRLSYPHLSIPLSTLPAQIKNIDNTRVVFICQSGKRSLLAAQYFYEQTDAGQQIFHLDGGMIALENYIND